MQVQVSGAAPAYVEDDSPTAERRYRARFYVNAGALTLASGDELELFSAYATGGARELSVLLGRSGTQNRLRLAVRRDDGVYVETAPGSEIALPREWHTVEIDWKAATSPSASDGSVAVWLDGQIRAGLAGIDNDQAQVGLVRWGAVAEVDATTTGSLPARRVRLAAGHLHRRPLRVPGRAPQPSALALRPLPLQRGRDVRLRRRRLLSERQRDPRADGGVPAARAGRQRVHARRLHGRALHATCR